jgi:putative phosphoesterase
MKIGVISDTHDNLPQIAKAVKLFNKEKVELVLHAGDFIAPFTSREFKELDSRLIGVFGNMDAEKTNLAEKFSKIGKIYESPYKLEVGGRRIILMHKETLVDSLSKSGDYEVVIYGHTHQVDLRKEKALILNPGECGGWLKGKPTVALLDLEKLEAEVIDL